MATTSGRQGVKPWLLGSGVWTSDERSGGFRLENTAQQHAAAAAVTSEDLRALLGAGNSALPADALFPPEFKFSPQTGQPLQAQSASTDSAWVPPFGVPPLLNHAARGARGMRQTDSALTLSAPDRRRAEDDPDLSLGLPPPGDYEFASVPAGTRVAALLAIEPSKGALYAWLPASRRWESLEHESGGLLAETLIAHADWRCEVAIDAQVSRIFMATALGLTTLVADVPGLCFAVSYLGAEPAIGAPIQFGEWVWAPLRSASGRIRFVSVDGQGTAGPVAELAAAIPGLGRVHSPLSDSRFALWPCAAGQLVLRKLADGGFEAGFQPWPKGVAPSFGFGSPYLSREGSLWQLCFDAGRESYVYLRLGAEQPELQPTLAPRLCTGTFYFRFATKSKREPWVEPEHGDDAQTDDLMLPLIESTGSGAVVGLRLETAAGLADVLGSTERMRAVLVVDETSGVTEFQTLAVAEPWRLRLFVHAGSLWAYHPLLGRLGGWKLQA